MLHCSPMELFYVAQQQVCLKYSINKGLMLIKKEALYIYIYIFINKSNNQYVYLGLRVKCRRTVAAAAGVVFAF
jgi:hypothetical protein